MKAASASPSALPFLGRRDRVGPTSAERQAARPPKPRRQPSLARRLVVLPRC